MRAGLSDACRWAPFGSYLSGVPFFAQLNLISIWQCRKPCLIATTGHMYHVFFLFFFHPPKTIENNIGKNEIGIYLQRTYKTNYLMMSKRDEHQK